MIERRSGKTSGPPKLIMKKKLDINQQSRRHEVRDNPIPKETRVKKNGRVNKKGLRGVDQRGQCWEKEEDDEFD